MSESATKKVLIIDDSATTRAVVKVYLAGHALEFLEATNGQDGLELARSARPDAIIIDLKMPGMDGLTFCRRVRAETAIRHVPIILITGSRGLDLRNEAIRSGASVFLNKPIDVPVLAKLVLSYVGPKASSAP
ncbi:MAG: response regulator [Myxococcales bacterium]|nr:response regulator [Myxococcales bacterium]